MSEQKTVKISVIILTLILIPVSFGILSILMGKDINWDLRNYHFYNGYSFIEHRLGFDIAPAQVQTYFNPLLDVPIYLLYKNLPSKLAGFLYGFLHGYNISLILLIFHTSSIIPSQKMKILLGLCLAIISSIAPGFLSELGGSMNDNIVSLAILLALFLIISSNKSLDIKFQYFAIGLAGFINGLTVGLKYTAVIFAISMVLLLPIMIKSYSDKIKTFCLFMAAFFLGFLISDGFWMITLGREFSSVLFPFYNNIFHSPLLISQPFLDQRFLPHNFIEYIFWPIIFSVNSLRVSELKFSDIRFGILFIIFIIWGVSILVSKLFKISPQRQRPSDHLIMRENSSNFILLFFVVSYIIWMLQFSIYRYIIVLELLVPLCVLLILDRIFSNKKIAYLSLFLLVILGSIYFTPFNWIRLPWSDPYVQVKTDPFQPVTKGVVVMLGNSPTAYVVPFFPKDIKFIRPESNFAQFYGPSLKAQIMEAITSTKYPIYILYDKHDSAVNLGKSGVNLGLVIDQAACKEIQDNMPEDLVLCPASAIKQTVRAMTP